MNAQSRLEGSAVHVAVCLAGVVVVVVVSVCGRRGESPIEGPVVGDLVCWSVSR